MVARITITPPQRACTAMISPNIQYPKATEIINSKYRYGTTAVSSTKAKDFNKKNKIKFELIPSNKNSDSSYKVRGCQYHIAGTIDKIVMTKLG